MAKKSFQPRQQKETKDDILTLEGVVEEALPGTLFRVKIDGEKPVTILATIAGRMRQRRIHLLPGDRVTVEVSAYDLTRGRVVWRKS
jgi:translation initiation factor IF-1